MNAVARSALARLLSFVPTAIATLITSRLILRGFGVHSFDSFALILALIALVPLNNLGVGAAVTNAYAADGPDAEHSRRVTLTAVRVLAVSSLGSAAVAAAITALGAWPTLIGTASGPNLYCGLAMVIYALSFLPGLGQSMLLGVHRNHVTVVVQTVFTPLILLGTVAVIVSGLRGDVLMLVPPAALVVVNVVTAVLATRATGVRWGPLLRDAPRRGTRPGASIRALSGPVLVVTLATPIALQSDRVVLSHVSTAEAVANYSVAIQIFAPALALIAASAQPLWPIFEAARSQGVAPPKLSRILLLFTAAALVIGGLLALIAAPVGAVIGGHAIDLGILLPVTGALAVVTTALSYPVAMSLMDPEGARFVAICTALALPINIVLSVVLGRRLGAPGPLLATIAVGVLLQALPGILHSRAREFVGRHRAPRGRARFPLSPAVALAGPAPSALFEEVPE